MSDVPSNLIPTRITQLPVAPVADENSLMMIVYQGNNYQIRVGDLLSVAGVPTSTQVIAGTGLAGGGQLTGNVTLSVAVGGIGNTQLADTGVASGTYGNSTNIPVFTVDAKGRIQSATTIPASGGGGVPTTTQVIAGTGLNGGGQLTSNVTLNANLSNALPLLTDGLGSAGVSTDISRADHQHPSINLQDSDEVDGVLSVANGGTSRSIVPSAGAIIWSGADGLYVGPVGSSGQVLVSGGAGAPTWGSALIVADQSANVVYAGPAAGAAAPTAFRALVNADLPASGVAANTYGSSTAIPVLTVNAKGVITSATTASFTGGLSYQGSWNASTNTPTLTSSVGVNGYYYIVSVAGSTNLNGITDWQVGDWAIFNGTVWQKIDQTNLVSSVNGQTGVVSIGYADLAGAIPTWNQNTTGTAANVTGVVAIANGGSGQTTASAAFNALSPITTTGDLILGNGTNSATRLAIGANGYLLSSDGTTASWQPAPAGGVTTFAGGTTGLTPASATSGAITLAGTLAVANGGTGLTSGTSGGVLAYTATGTLASSALLAANALMVGGGAGVAPSTVTTGTGVVTALGVNTGSAGAFVVNGGDLGTPSSGTVTNLTGTASININGTVGATTANTGAFTTVSATGVITSTVATGTAPFTVASTTQVANLNAATAGSATNATNATNVNLAAGTGATNYLTFSATATGNQPLTTNTLLTYNYTNNALTAGISGGAF
jgi:trimeric autotransporter adhesin